MAELEEIQQAIAALEAQRGLLGDQVVDTALAPLREKLARLSPSLDSPDQQLKLVTVLFTDVVGSTQLGSDLDPEDTLAIMDTALRRFRELIEQNSGQVLRFMGDGLKAVFGAPLSQEDDAERAVRSGLALLRDCQIYSQEVETKWGVRDFNIRVGIHSGRVLLGGGVEADKAAMGMPINLAARMESSAPPGNLRISSDTYRLVRGLFEVEEQEPILVKGRDAPMQTYLVRGEKPRAFHPASRGLPGGESPLVGREAELAQLRATYQAVLDSKGAQFITIIGEPGVGKSRLLDEFTQWLETGSLEMPLFFRGRAMPQTTKTPYALLNYLLAVQFNIRSSDSAAQACLKLQEGLAPYLEEEPVLKTHFIGALVGYSIPNSPYLLGVKDDAIQLRDRALFYLGQFFEALTTHAPTVIFLDDIHWADRSSLEAILHICQACARNRLLVVCLARMRLFEEYPKWGDPEKFQGVYTQRIDLSPLSPQDSHRLLNKILVGMGDLSGNLREVIVNNAEGNPYYLEELVQVLIDDGVIAYDPPSDSWQVNPGRGENLRIPATLTAILQSRLDSLPAPHRRILQQASVVGRNFWDALLVEMEDKDASPDQELDALCHRRLIIHQTKSDFKGTNEYVFKHAISRDVTYETLLKRDRKRYHARVAAWLERITRASGRQAEYQALIAGHYDLAGKSILAARGYQEAGKLASKQGAFQEACELYERAMRLVDPDDPGLRFQILLGWSDALGVLGENELSLEQILKLIQLGKQLGQTELAEAYYRYGYYQYSQGDCRSALQTFDLALEAAERVSARRIKVLSSALRLVCLSLIGDKKTAQDEAGALSEQIIEIEEISAAQVLINLAVYYLQSGELAEAAHLFSQQARIANKLGNPRIEAVALTNLGYSYVMLGLFNEGIQSLNQSLQIHRSIGERNMNAYDLLNRSLACWRMEDFVQAYQDLSNAGELLNKTGDTYGLAARLVYLGMVEESSYEIQRAMQCYSDALGLFEKMRIHGPTVDARAGLARCSLIEGDLATARQYTIDIENTLQETDTMGMEFPIWAYLTCARVWQAIGDFQRVLGVIDDGYTNLTVRAKKISDPSWRKSFLENIPEHRDLATLWVEVQSLNGNIPI